MCSTTLAMLSADHFFCLPCFPDSESFKIPSSLCIFTLPYTKSFFIPRIFKKKSGILVFLTVFDKKVVICHLSLRIFAIVCSSNRCLFHIFSNNCLWSFMLPIFQYCWKTDRLSSSEISALLFRGHAEPHGGAKARALKLLPVSDT